MKVRLLSYSLLPLGLTLAGVLSVVLLALTVAFWPEPRSVFEPFSMFQKSVVCILFGLCVAGTLGGFCTGVVTVLRRQHLASGILAILLSLLVMGLVLVPLTRPLD
jgi:hypothetical protein